MPSPPPGRSCAFLLALLLAVVAAAALPDGRVTDGVLRELLLRGGQASEPTPLQRPPVDSELTQTLMGKSRRRRSLKKGGVLCWANAECKSNKCKMLPYAPFGTLRSTGGPGGYAKQCVRAREEELAQVAPVVHENEGDSDRQEPAVVSSTPDTAFAQALMRKPQHRRRYGIGSFGELVQRDGA